MEDQDARRLGRRAREDLGDPIGLASREMPLHRDVPDVPGERSERHPVAAEGAGQIEGALAVSTSGTHSARSRGGRPSVFNLVRIDPRAVHIQHFRWQSDARRFLRSDTYSFARMGPPRVAVSVAGGDQGL